jgi:hypothetical protein
MKGMLLSQDQVALGDQVPRLVVLDGGAASVPRPAPIDAAGATYRQRALAFWPRLDRARLARTRGDPARIARIVSRRTVLPHDTIVAMLTDEQSNVPAVRAPGRDRVGDA